MTDKTWFGLWQKLDKKKRNNMIDCIGLVYAKTETELLGPIWPGAICYEKLNKTMTWPIIKVHSTLKTILNYHDQSN